MYTEFLIKKLNEFKYFNKKINLFMKFDIKCYKEV